MSLYVMSHLSDVQEVIDPERYWDSDTDANTRINFVKYLIGKCEGDLNKEYSTEEMDEFWTEFNERFNK